MQKAQAWCQKNRNMIGLYEHEAMMTDICADAVRDVLVPGPKEMNLIELYSDVDAMSTIADANAAATNMLGSATRIGIGWYGATAAGLAAGVALCLRGHRVGGGAVAGVAAVGAVALAWASCSGVVRRTWRRTWDLPTH